MNEIRYIVMLEYEIRLAEEMRDISSAAGNKIIHADNVVAFGNKAIAKMATKKSGTAGDESTRHRLNSMSSNAVLRDRNELSVEFGWIFQQPSEQMRKHQFSILITIAK
jgi:hypothetical protein